MSFHIKFVLFLDLANKRNKFSNYFLCICCQIKVDLTKKIIYRVFNIQFECMKSKTLYDTKYPDIICKISRIHFKNRVCTLSEATCCCDRNCYPNIMTEGSTSKYMNVVSFSIWDSILNSNKL